MDDLTPLHRAIAIIGSQSALAAIVNCTPQAISDRLRRGRPAAAEWCIAIEQATEGRVTRHELRPDIYPLAENDERIAEDHGEPA